MNELYWRKRVQSLRKERDDLKLQVGELEETLEKLQTKAKTLKRRASKAGSETD